jgi:hypothetical protein
MSDFKLEFTLKQHTPMIHFQSDQAGATLRATELKPKLDKFLIKYAFNDDFEKYKEFLIGYDSKKKESDFDGKKAFDYKVKISNDTSIKKIMDDRNPLYFANMGKDEDKKMKQKFNENNKPKIHFFTFNKEIKNAIEKNFEAFLAQTNFGARQSKGFGSFYLDKSFNKELIKKYEVYNFSLKSNSYEKDIGLFYSFLRAGINRPCSNRDRDDQCPDGREDERGRKKTRVYIKAAIFHYAKHLGITWDKKAIKHKYFNNKLLSQQRKYSSDSPVNYDSNNERLIRDLFGLSSEQSWGNDTISKSHQSIERFKSPITFKPIVDGDKVTVYFWSDDKRVRNITGEKEFLVKYNGRGDLELKTPETFSFDDFFEYIFKKSITDFADPKYSKQNEYKTINYILNQLRSQV